MLWVVQVAAIYHFFACVCSLFVVCFSWAFMLEKLGHAWLTHGQALPHRIWDFLLQGLSLAVGGVCVKQGGSYIWIEGLVGVISSFKLCVCVCVLLGVQRKGGCPPPR